MSKGSYTHTAPESREIVNVLLEDSGLPPGLSKDLGRESPGKNEIPVTPPIDDGSEKSGNDQNHRPLLIGLQTVLLDAGAPAPVIDSMSQQVAAFLRELPEEELVRRSKFLVTHYMADYLDRTAGSESKIDVPSDPDWQPSGQWKLWSRRRLRLFKVKNTHLWYSWLQAKRSASPLSSLAVNSAYEKHSRAISSVDPIDDEILEVCAHVQDRLLQKLRRALKSEVPGYAQGWPTFTHSASTGACYERPRSHGGQVSFLADLSVTDVRQCVGDDSIQPDLSRMYIEPLSLENSFIRHHALRERFVNENLERGWNEGIHLQLKNVVSTPNQNRMFRAKVAAITEPLKVRTVTSMEAVPSYASKPLQMAIHSIMRRIPRFRLIGEPMCPTYLQDLVPLGGEEGLEWISIDYSAATDNVSASLAMQIFRTLTDWAHPDVRSVWERILAPHIVEYPPEVGVKPVKMTNGQLMGSILSFPILNLENDALYRVVIREAVLMINGLSDGKKVTPWSESIAERWPRFVKPSWVTSGNLSNGDDMLYCAPGWVYDLHTRIGRKFGLEMSAGKAYHHPAYANINSACYHLDLRKSGSTSFSIPYLNTGLMSGQNKVISRSDVDDPEKTYCSLIGKIARGARNPVRMVKIFLKRFRRQIAEETCGRNIFLPAYLGGMGVTPIDGFKYIITMEQRFLAHQILNSGTPKSLECLPNRKETYSQFDLRERCEKRLPWDVGLELFPPCPDITLDVFYSRLECWMGHDSLCKCTREPDSSDDEDEDEDESTESSEREVDERMFDLPLHPGWSHVLCLEPCCSTCDPFNTGYDPRDSSVSEALWDQIVRGKSRKFCAFLGADIGIERLERTELVFRVIDDELEACFEPRVRDRIGLVRRLLRRLKEYRVLWGTDRLQLPYVFL